MCGCRWVARETLRILESPASGLTFRRARRSKPHCIFFKQPSEISCSAATHLQLGFCLATATEPIGFLVLKIVWVKRSPLGEIGHDATPGDSPLLGSPTW